MRQVSLRLATVALADIPVLNVAVVVVTGPPTVDGYTLVGGWVCGSRLEATIALHAWTVQEAFDSADPEGQLARVIAHELAHVVLHSDPVGRQAEQIQREYEADYLGAYYFVTAGFKCQPWLDDLRRVMSQTAVRAGRGGPGGIGRGREIIRLRQEAVERGCQQAATGQHPLRGPR